MIDVIGIAALAAEHYRIEKRPRHSEIHHSRAWLRDISSGVEQAPTEPLEHPPAGQFVRHRSCGNRSRLVADCLAVRRFDVYFSHAFGHHEPADRLFNGAPNREEAVIAEDAQFRVAQRCRDSLAAVGGENLDFFVVKQRLVENKGRRLLAQRTKRLDVRRPGRTELGVRVARAHHVRASFEQRRMNVVARCIRLLYISDAADDLPCLDLGGRRIIKKKTPH